MKCIAPADVDDILGPCGFSVSLNHEWYRKSLVLDKAQASNQSRVGGRPQMDASQLATFALAAARWLPTLRHRVLWIDHWNSDYPSISELFFAARVGLGEVRSISEAPGHLFDPFPYDNQDQTEISSEQAKEVSILIGLMSLTMISGWDAWLVANGTVDRIEFWEGNIFFHSSSATAVARAEAVLNQFNCSRSLA